MKGKNLFISVLMLTLLLAIPFAYAVDDYCTYCGEKEYTFTKTGLDLGTTNTLKIVGHDTHGVTYISINCEIEDTGPPVTNITPDGSSWGNSNVAFALDCQDDSGCQATYYKVINDGESCGATGFSAGTSGTVTCGSGQVCRKRICYYSKDTAGNTEDTRKSGVFEIDREIPFTSISLSGTLGGDNWYTSNVDVTLACSDAGSGCSVTEYCIDTTNTCLPSNTYSSAFTVSGNGKNYVRYRSVDSTGNQEGIKTREIKIDKVKPATQIIPDGRPWTNTDVAFSLTCIDTHSLCQITYFKVTDYDDPCGSSGYVTGNTGSVPCSSGETCRKKVCYYSKDNAGNTESVKESGTFEIDRQTPTVTVTGNPAEWQNADVDAYVDCYDGGSGCNTDSFMIKVYASQPANCPHNYNEYDHMSPHTISSHSWVCGAAKDNVENTGFSSPIEFKVDKNPPTPSILDPAISVTKDSVTLQWNHNNDEDFESYEVHYSESQGFTPTDYTLIKRIADKGTTTYMIEGLEEETTYYFKIVTADVTGLTSVSNEISETTHFCDVGETKSCGSNIGECSNGTSTCDDNGKWGPCIGYIGPANETCNGKDDDCDGVIDNVDGKNSIEATKCACFGGVIHPGEVEEICNAIDDDCNGQIDDGIDCNCTEGETKACGSNIGECSNGTSVCMDGQWGECIGYTGPANETCNGKDDDCDGVIDNVGNGLSIEDTKCHCFNGSFPVNETCNWIDDDCNGQIDDGIDCNCTEGETKACGSNIGECSNGTSVCMDGQWGECIGYTGPANETCNGKDDDCDGVIDNVDGKNSIEATKCACYGETYTAGELSETCNWIDDDCNEQVDDGINCGCMEGQKKSCGSDIGECASGERKCVNGEWGECVGSVGPETEICNGKDDNCDGTVDNVYGGNSPESAKCACYGGFSQRGAEAETCNGIDDNCDGRIDEGCPGGGYAAGPNCNNGIQDGNEEGVDCGGSCLPCPTAPEIPEWSWLVVFLIFVVVIAVVGVALVFFEKK